MSIAELQTILETSDFLRSMRRRRRLTRGPGQQEAVSAL
jgi:hypothetical protein